MRASAVLLLGAMTAMALPAQNFTTLLSFNGRDGAYPYAGLVQGVDGNLYGTTQSGGSHKKYGAIFKITPGGALTTIYSFCAQSACLDGESPRGSLVQAANGEFYGTTIGGGASGQGTVFEITPSGTLATLYSFCAQGVYPNCPDGEAPFAGLLQASDGNFLRDHHRWRSQLCSQRVWNGFQDHAGWRADHAV